MTAISGSSRRTFAFGDLDTGLWGVVWVPSQGSALATVSAPGGSPSTITVSSLEGTDPGSEWRASGEALELAVAPESEAAALEFGDVSGGGFDQLCRVHGRVDIGGATHAIDCFGRRGIRTDAARAASIRELAAWFGGDEGLAVVSLRGSRSAGHDADAVSAALFEEGHPITVAVPRLSTTYTADGLPASASLELWLEEAGSEEAGSEEAEPSYPRRAAGEAVGRGWQGEHDGLELRVELFRWHMRGRDGTGVYQLISTR